MATLEEDVEYEDRETIFRTVPLSPEDQKRLDRALFGSGLGLVFGPINKQTLNKLMDELDVTTYHTPFFDGLTLLEHARSKKFKSVSYLEKRRKRERPGFVFPHDNDEAEDDDDNAVQTSNFKLASSANFQTSIKLTLLATNN